MMSLQNYISFVMEFLKKISLRDLARIYVALLIEYSCNQGCLPTRTSNITEQKASFL